MYEAYIFLNNCFEEMEAVAPIDILRRGEVSLATVSLTGEETVTGSHGIPVKTDMLFDSAYFSNQESGNRSLPLLILPGGPGTADYWKNDAFLKLLTSHCEIGGRLAAICAAPSVPGGLGLLRGKCACCYPGYEDKLTGAEIGYENVITDGNITTSRSAATAFEFGLELLSLLRGKETAEKVRTLMPYAMPRAT